MQQLLSAWDRYACLLDEQLDALEGVEPDLDRFHDLARACERLAAEIDAMGAPPVHGTTLGDRALLRRSMEACSARDRAVLDRISTLRRATADALRGTEERTRARAGYLAGAQAMAAEARSRIDVTS